MRFAKPRALRPKDLVAVVAPAGPFPREVFDAGLAILSSRYQPRVDEGIYSSERYFAGTDDRRLNELQRAFDDDDVKGVFAARGGYGVMRLLRKLRIKSPPKPIVGFSDLTALHLAQQSLGGISFHAPVLTQLGKQPPEVAANLFHLLEKDTPRPALLAKETWNPGVAEGPLLGGNLSLLTHLLGTPYAPDFKGAVLLLEDIGERPYRLDRLWMHLELAGVFDAVAGIALGDFTDCEDRNVPFTSSDVLRELAQRTGKPCAFGFPVGHGVVNEPVPLGANVRLDAGARMLTFLEGAVS